MTKILLIEDEPGLVVSLTDRLLSEGYAVESVGDGETGTARALLGSHDLVLLDVMLPRKGGFDVCRDLRQKGVETPILILTARCQVMDRVLGLKLGADDFLAKPFDPLELLARIESLLRRSRSIACGTARYAFGDIVADFERAEFRRGGSPLNLSAVEFRLLRYFLEHRGELLTRNRLLDEVWGYRSDVFSRTVDQHVATLRRKVEPHPSCPRFLLTVHGLGYKFVA